MRKQLMTALIERLKLIQIDNDGSYIIASPTGNTPPPDPGDIQPLPDEPTPIDPPPPDPIPTPPNTTFDEEEPAESAIKHFDLWNQQLEYLDEEQPFNTPAVFIEFLPIQWRHQSRGTRDATLSINLHIVTRRNFPKRADQQYATEALSFFELLDAVNLCLHGHKGENFGALTSQLSTTGCAARGGILLHYK